MSQSSARGAFTGTLSQDLVFPYPQMHPEEAQVVQMLRDSIRKYAMEHIDDARIDAEGKMPREILDALAEMGIMGMIIPEAYGGSGMSVTRLGERSAR